MILIADSGSTKTDWVLHDGQSIVSRVKTHGLNPTQQSAEEIYGTLIAELDGKIAPDAPKTIYFYGAGCAYDNANMRMQKALEQFFTTRDIHIHSDLLAAARALCGHEEGIACILGTGSNSCLCKGGKILQNTSPLGYILGDEGSGAVLGRTLLSEMLKGNLKDLWPHFHKRYRLEVSDIINKVYRQPQANRFLASLVPFIKEHRQVDAIKEMLVIEFTRFLQRNVVPYNRPDLPVNFVGGVANNFTTEIYAACEACGLKYGKTIALPAQEIQKYHLYVI